MTIAYSNNLFDVYRKHENQSVDNSAVCRKSDKFNCKSDLTGEFYMVTTNVVTFIIKFYKSFTTKTSGIFPFH